MRSDKVAREATISSAGFVVYRSLRMRAHTGDGMDSRMSESKGEDKGAQYVPPPTIIPTRTAGRRIRERAPDEPLLGARGGPTLPADDG